MAFSDANAHWEPDALRKLVARFGDPRTGYVCGQVHVVSSQGTNQEGLYWRYEMWIRTLESRVRSITAGNGSIYATRRESYLASDGIMGHDLGFPFKMVKGGWRALYAPEARSTELMLPSIEGEFSRKRRMASQTWRTTLRGGMLSPRGYDPLYAWMIFSHRFLRYMTPFIHVVALGTNIALVGQGWVYVVTLDPPAGGTRGRAPGPARAAARAAGRALLRPDHRLAGGRPVGLAAPRRTRDVGADRGLTLSAPPARAQASPGGTQPPRSPL